MMGNMFASTKIMNFILPPKTGLVLVLGCRGLFNLLKKNYGSPILDQLLFFGQDWEILYSIK